MQSGMVQLHTYTGEGTTVKGSSQLQFSESQVLTVTLLVVPGQGPSLLG